MNSTGLDPSGAWQTASGEWRFVGNGRAEATGCPGNATTETTPIYGSKDFVSWYKVGCTTLPAGDCPTLFPRPALTPGSTDGMSAAEIAALPTHVYKAGLFAPGNYDTCWFGDLKDGSPGREGVGSVGSWVRRTRPLFSIFVILLICFSRPVFFFFFFFFSIFFFSTFVTFALRLAQASAA